MEYKTLKEFWPYYLSEHSNPTNRLLHFIGSWIAIGFLICTIYTLNAFFLIGAVLSGYAFAWVGHFLIEKNRPATFKYPFKSLVSDWIMFYYILTGQIQKELDKNKG
ncbi:DUF962 domain-containing protein [Leptospira sp. GIMC2001]|uniref:DUF962 domain-containing protein n=1 Tax=Leptospira sp. GIMC2001 TaxID=1513297 RepID=UPI00234BF82F|nr:DUF962 domain-containing protein [Leptospira sp. GIMC2001]WCL48953.1 DUF962 domain-containing protein [Leptospira sp. GIMC2001]